jgi:hypothetical protein
MSVNKQKEYILKVTNHLVKHTDVSLVNNSYLVTLKFLNEDVSFRLKDLHNKVGKGSNYSSYYRKITIVLETLYGLNEWETYKVIKKYRKKMESTYNDQYLEDRKKPWRVSTTGGRCSCPA